MCVGGAWWSFSFWIIVLQAEWLVIFSLFVKFAFTTTVFIIAYSLLTQRLFFWTKLVSRFFPWHCLRLGRMDNLHYCNLQASFGQMLCEVERRIFPCFRFHTSLAWQEGYHEGFRPYVSLFAVPCIRGNRDLKHREFSWQWRRWWTKETGTRTALFAPKYKP